MANLTDERLKEMEEEMNRFEEEIFDGPVVPLPLPKTIIGTKTFSNVEAQLLSNRSAASPPPAASDVKVKVQETVTPSEGAFPGSLAPPPRPPPVATIGPRLPDSILLNTQPPPPPPPGFIPPQLRHRPPIPPMPPRCPMPPHMQGMMPPRLPGMGMGPPRPPPSHPGMLPPPPLPPSHMFGNQMPQNPYAHGPAPPTSLMNMPFVRPAPAMSTAPSFNFNRPPVMSSAPVQRPAAANQPKIIYAAPPIRRVTTETAGCLGSTTTTTVGKTTADEKLKPFVEETTCSVASGIELNVPVQKIEAEKMQNFAGGSSVTAVAGDAADGAAGSAGGQAGSKKKEKKKKFVRMAAGTVWEDQTLGEWDQDDFRLFCGDLGNEVTDETLARAFNKYPSFQKARVIRDKRSNKTKGFGFVSFKDPNDFTKAMREMNGKYVGNRPIKLRKSQWRERQIDIVKKKDKEKKRLGFR